MVEKYKKNAGEGSMKYNDDLTQDVILAYMKHLAKTWNLNVSIHISEKYFNVKCNGQLSKLLKYNRHINPYCIYIKNVKQQQRKCVLCQNMAIRKCADNVCYVGVCHAGVKEYIHRIVVDGDVAGYVSVSGYKGGTAEETNKWYDDYLMSEPVPTELLDVLIPPLCSMLSQLILRARDLKSAESLYSQIRDYLEENHSAVTLDEISRKFSYSKSYISHMFKKESGCTLKSYCNKLKVRDAMQLLYSTNISVTDIAYMVGFNNFSYFINTFKKITGITPLEYRKNEHENTKTE